jgi:hypothetical protein
MIRPSSKDDARIASEGPQITQAGSHNYKSATVSDGFAKKAIERHLLSYFVFEPASK